MTILEVRNVDKFDGDGLATSENVAFCASPGNIVDRENSDPPSETIDGSGCTLIPALIDSHVDVTGYYRALRTFGSWGIATVCDMSSTCSENQAMRIASKNDVGLPDYLASGTAAVAPHTGGLGKDHLRETQKIHSAEEADAFVAARVDGRLRADYIKVIADIPGFEEPILAALATASHRHGLLAIAQTTQAEGYRRALRAGFDVVTQTPLDEPIDDETARELAEKKVACVTTLSMARRLASRLQKEREGQGERLGQAGASGHSEGQHYDFSHAMTTVKKLYKAGVRVCAGTAANITSQDPVSIGESLHEELELLVEAGFSNLDALRAATTNPATVFGLHDRGMLQSGRRADLILLEGNPLEDIRATRRIRKAWIRGIEVDVDPHIVELHDRMGAPHLATSKPPATASCSFLLAFLTSLELAISPITPKEQERLGSAAAGKRRRSEAQQGFICMRKLPEEKNKGITPRQLEKQRLAEASNLRTVLGMLRSMSEAESLDMMKSIRHAQTLDDAVNMIADAGLLLHSWGPRQPSASNSIPSFSAISVSPLEIPRHAPRMFQTPVSPSSPPAVTPTILPVSRWTAVSRDDVQLTHMLNLFWTWDHTLTHILDKAQFLGCLRSDTPTLPRFCSDFLVNSILAVASIFLEQDSPDSAKAKALGRQFAVAAFDILKSEINYQSITLAQGMAVLWMYELNFGDRERAKWLLEEVYKTYKNLRLDTMRAASSESVLCDPAARRTCNAISKICWGFYSLAIKASLAFAGEVRVKKPETPRESRDKDSGVWENPESAEHLWLPYPDLSDARYSREREVFLAECALSELIEEGLALAAGPRDYERSRKVYQKLLDWKNSLPDGFQTNADALPNVIFLHNTFDMAVLKLLGPFCQVPSLESSAGQGVHQTAAFHAISIVFNLSAYQTAYGLRHEYWLTQALYSAADAIVVYMSMSTPPPMPITTVASRTNSPRENGEHSVAMDVLVKACKLLSDLSRSGALPPAKDCLLAIQNKIHHHGIQLPNYAVTMLSSAARVGGTTRIRHVGVVMQLLLPANGEDDDDAQGGTSSGSSHYGIGGGGGGVPLDQVDSMMVDDAPSPPHDVMFSSIIENIGKLNILN
ncbi:hypothetical protein QBC46DRAFT_409619 [Diplogelasinospora grovesii]|uniref:Amidohydrolase-related domain-containing protein n=1 Tax=Diplogelasinospora grovesii TaxID=303347 RepID=A0AAN6N5P5_9PEZI|nr:hypothetical protein QBC46DRAFT_409619 [Diplogelasinospora grovesii]